MNRFTLLSLLTLMLCTRAPVTAQTNSSTPEKPTTLKLDEVKSFGREPLYIVDGKVMGTVLNELNPDQIESLSILKDISAIAQYGKEGANGVIIIKTKNQPEKVDINTLIIRGDGTYGKNPVMVLDGKLLNQTSINELDPNKIQSFTILKDASAVALYGKEAENGVILIVTKKEKPSKDKN